jgi:hypothetical protein
VEKNRTANLHVRMTEKEMGEFKADAEKRNMTASEFLRYIWQAFKDRLTKEKRP